MTEAKRELISDTRAPIESRLEDLVAGAVGAFEKELVSLDVIRSSVRDDPFERRPSNAAVTSALRSLGHSQLSSQVRLTDQSRPLLWVVRNHDKWGSATPQQVREEMER